MERYTLYSEHREHSGGKEMRALGYGRISKDEENSISLDYQVAEIKKLAKAHGYKLIDIETDNGISGKSIKNRPAVQRVLQAVDQGVIDAVIVFKSDRMSRDGLETIQVEKLMRARNVAYLSATEGDLLGNGVDDEFMSFIRAGLNQRERKLISLRTKAALDHKREKGERIGGQLRYGFKVVNGEVIEDPQEQAAIARIKALHGKGYSTREVVKALELEGITTRKGSNFGQTQICRILKAAA
jgi:site-specific DNA recombinase